MSETAETGHNSNEQLKSIVERYENVGEQIKALQEDQKDIMAEAKGNGYDPKILRRVVSIRKQDKAKRDEAEAILERYMAALGMI
jgi:uncharacterized protein (UPF0335 family)